MELMAERIERMRDCYEVFMQQGEFEIDDLLDPWAEVSMVDVALRLTELTSASNTCDLFCALSRLGAQLEIQCLSSVSFQRDFGEASAGLGRGSTGAKAASRFFMVQKQSLP